MHSFMNALLIAKSSFCFFACFVQSVMICIFVFLSGERVCVVLALSAAAGSVVPDEGG
jgi:hypothetical protein